MKTTEIVKFLSRQDKWYLGGGNNLSWAPTFPAWLHFPGLWDEAIYFNYSLAPLYTITILDHLGHNVHLRLKHQLWDPSNLERHFSSDIQKLEIIEKNVCLPDEVLVSELEITSANNAEQTFHVIAWTVQENHRTEGIKSISDIKATKDGVSFHTTLSPKKRREIALLCELSISNQSDSFCVQSSEDTVIQPHWHLTPFYNLWSDHLNNTINVSGNDKGLIFMGIHKRVVLSPGSNKKLVVRFRASTNKLQGYVRGGFGSSLLQSNKNWKSYFENVPNFACSDEFFTRYYWHRWYGLKLMTLPRGETNYSHPAICEGIGYFRAPISYSAHCHMRETRWMTSPDIAQGSLLNFVAGQRDNNSYPGYIDPHGDREEMFYHANWGASVLEVHRIHHDQGFLDSAYKSLTKYCEYFDRERDSEGSGLYDIHNHYETGQEYMSRYTAVSPDADKVHWGEQIRLKGVDVTVYIYELKKALVEMASILRRPDRERRMWKEGYKKTKASMLREMWDPHEEMFFDVNPQTGERTRIMAATCFYPYMTDIVSENHVNGLRRHLLNPDEFWTPYPIPSTSVNDPTFSAGGLWKGKRMNCPWNGRVWPMTNSHIAEALAETAIHFDSSLRPIVAEFIRKFICMMFYDGDVKRPNCFEHYHPYTGKPSAFRGVDDYQHSWVVDLILKYMAGIRPKSDSIIIDPFPFGLKWLEVSKIMIRGHSMEVRIDEESFTVRVDDRPPEVSVLGKPLEIAI